MVDASVGAGGWVGSPALWIPLQQLATWLSGENKEL